MEVTSLREPKMADRVATVLRRMFIRGEITEGTMLPPESELMERFGGVPADPAVGVPGARIGVADPGSTLGPWRRARHPATS